MTARPRSTPLPLRRLAALSLLLACAAPAAGQQATAPRPLDHGDYDRWNRIAGERLSPDGRWVAYRLVPGDGDATAVLRATDGPTELRLERGGEMRFTPDGSWLVLLVSPAEQALEEARERREEDRTVRLPGDTLVTVDLAALRTAGPASAVARRTADVDEMLVADEGAARVALLLDAPPEAEDEVPGDSARAGGAERGGASAGPRKPEGRPLVLLDLAGGAEHRFEDAADAAWSRDGVRLWYVGSTPDGAGDGLFRVDAASGARSDALVGAGRYLGLTLDRAGNAAVLTDRDAAADTSAAQRPLDLWWAGAGGGDARKLAHADAAGMPEGWWIGPEGQPSFSHSGRRVFFGTRPRPAAPDGDDGSEGEEADDDEEVRVDVWNWKDPHLQPMQLLQAEDADERTWRAMVAVDGGTVVQLETEDLPDVEVGDRGDGRWALGENDLPYRKLVSWDGRYRDFWVIDLETGERRTIAEAVKDGASLSPDGRFVSWWDGEARQWWVHDVERGTSITATADLPVALHDELDDHPDLPPPYGAAGWTEDGRLAVYDAHDLWLVDPSEPGASVNATGGLGRREGLRLRWIPLDDEQRFVPTDEPALLSAFHTETKADGFYRGRLDGRTPPERLVLADEDFGRPERAEEGDRLLLTRETFRDFPDLWVTGPAFDDMRRLSDANPWQDEYRWGTAELYRWRSADGTPLQGVLYKPDGFDPSERHPMMVYFYERSSDGLHGYHVPAPGSSSINRSFYVSRGYLLFVPDIPYEIGFPGESALDAVVPGVLALIDDGFVDPDRVGVQGHSWGGYQIAHMLTRTNLFRAAEAGAPVANMTSAYGGIRWGSGMSRMFQYERTQSRIGGTLWDAQHRYIENSPLFFADKIRTPLLMMHNDEDGAVPWYQGIEMFVALRRLGKPVWMLNYNGEDHGLRQDHNRRDWAIRMQQFFDHYLKDAPPPVWLVEGVPAERKGETLGLELVEEPAAATAGAGGGR